MANSKYKKALFGYITLKGYIKCLTGLHIGGCADSVEIGGIDAPVIRNPVNGYPFIPGSSLKGRLRSIVEKAKHLKFERDDGKVRRHECDDISAAIICPVCKIFGSTGKNRGDNFPSPIIVKDCIFDKNRKIYINNATFNEPNKNFFDGNLLITEAKMENAIDRVTAAAHPRTIERVPEGAIFDFEIIYKVETTTLDGKTQPQYIFDNVKKDIETIINALIATERDGLGGFTSRGSGQVEFYIEKFIQEKVDGTPPTHIITIADKSHKSLLYCKTELTQITSLIY